ncbi:hypothetical protein LWI28_010838 [Acer negundo]|uniref:Uncharacterized protein n=1 Tax=Acer negundo TaxID=4023 RepID=A0AAD5NXP0_ACENE|nr:hypothetical protein LWI28_010838 [Acer negundo]
MEQTRMPAHIIAQNNDPKFQLVLITYLSMITPLDNILRKLNAGLRYSHYFGDAEFKVSPICVKMSRGELIIDDNQVKPAASGDWAAEYQQQDSGICQLN